MDVSGNAKKKDSTRIILAPPTFSPPPEMRKGYLERRQAELESMLDYARAGEWKPVVNIVNHVRGTGSMYGFPNINTTAEELSKAIQNGDSNCLEYLDTYIRSVRESYV